MTQRSGALHSTFLRPTDRLLITGHTGFVGSALMKFLKSSGMQVVGAELNGVPTDLTDLGGTRTLLDTHRPDAVLHGAALTEDASPARQVHHNLTMLMNVLDALPDGCRRLIFFSSTGVYTQPHRRGEQDQLGVATDQAYAVSKLLGERLLETRATLQSWALRLGPLVGADERPSQARPRTTLLEQIRRSVRTQTPLTLHAHPDDRYDYLHLADLARLLLHLPAPTRAGQVLDVAGPALDLSRVLAECERALPDLRRWVGVQDDRPCSRQAIGPAALESLDFFPRWTLREMVEDYMNADQPQQARADTGQSP